MIDQLWLIPLGFVAGILGSIIGLGGGIIVVPVLTFMGFPPTLASSNSLFAALSNAAASTISYSRQKRIDYQIGLKLGLFSIPGTILGAFVSSNVTSDLFKILFGIVLLAACVYMFLKKRIETSERKIARKIMSLSIAASFFAGIISSFFGIGGGIVFVPLMVVALGMTMKKAAPTSQFVLLFASASGVIAHSLLEHPDFTQSGLLSIGAFVGGIIGARLSLDIKENSLQIIVSIVIVAAAVKLFFDAAVSSIESIFP